MADDLERKGLENQAKGAAKEASGKVRNELGGEHLVRRRQTRRFRWGPEYNRRGERHV